MVPSLDDLPLAPPCFNVDHTLMMERHGPDPTHHSTLNTGVGVWAEVLLFVAKGR